MEESKDSSITDLIHQANLPSEITWPDRLLAVLNTVPHLGGVIATWVYQNRQRVVFERIKTCLIGVVSKLERIEYDLRKLDSDDHFAELAIPILEITGRTTSEEKRECFANMLANAAILTDKEEREKVYSLAALLDQLDFIHVATLDRLMRMPYGQSVLFFGAIRTIPKVDVRHFSKQEHYALGFLENLGLIDISDLRNHSSQNLGEVKVNGRGISLHRWITEPRK